MQRRLYCMYAFNVLCKLNHVLLLNNNSLFLFKIHKSWNFSHSLFWARVLCDIPALAKYRFPIVINEVKAMNWRVSKA